MKTACVVLAGGMGTRMKSTSPKVLFTLSGITMLESVIRAARRLRPEKIIVVAGRHIDAMKEAISGDDILYALQPRANGTGDALKCAVPLLGRFKKDVVILNADAPLISAGTLRRFLGLHRRHRNRISILSFIATAPNGYGRITRDSSGRVVSIVEEKDADPDQKKISEVNSGVYAISPEALRLLDNIRINRLKKEYYLTDIVSLSLSEGLKTEAYCIGSEEELMGVNTPEELVTAAALMKKNIVNGWIRKGVLFQDPQSAFIHADVSIRAGTVIYPNVHLEGKTKVGKDSVIYPNVRISDSVIGSKVRVMDSTIIEGAIVRDGASVGPFARIRPGSDIGACARIGNFVELKKVSIGKDSKASHLSYLGDAKIGSGVNIGAGTITCNYDGRTKHQTIIKDRVFVGSDTQFVAPVTVGKDSFIGAGSTIVRDVPPHTLALSRSKQTHSSEWIKRRRKQTGSPKSAGK